MANRHSVFVVANAPVLPVIELRNFRLIAVANRKTHEGTSVPKAHFLHRFDHGFRTQFRCASRRADDP